MIRESAAEVCSPFHVEVSGYHAESGSIVGRESITSIGEGHQSNSSEEGLPSFQVGSGLWDRESGMLRRSEVEAAWDREQAAVEAQDAVPSRSSWSSEERPGRRPQPAPGGARPHQGCCGDGPQLSDRPLSSRELAIMRALADGDAVVPVPPHPLLVGRSQARSFCGDLWYWTRNHHPWLGCVPCCPSALHPTSRRHKLLMEVVCLGAHFLLAVLVAFWAGYCFQRANGGVGSLVGDDQAEEGELGAARVVHRALYLDLRSGECLGHDATVFRDGDYFAALAVALLAFPAERAAAALLSRQALEFVRTLERAAKHEAVTDGRAHRRPSIGDEKDDDSGRSPPGADTTERRSSACEGSLEPFATPSRYAYLRPACPLSLAVLGGAEMVCAGWLLWAAPLRASPLHEAASIVKIATVAAIAEATVGQARKQAATGVVRSLCSLLTHMLEVASHESSPCVLAPHAPERAGALATGDGALLCRAPRPREKRRGLWAQAAAGNPDRAPISRQSGRWPGVLVLCRRGPRR